MPKTDTTLALLVLFLFTFIEFVSLFYLTGGVPKDNAGIRTGLVMMLAVCWVGLLVQYGRWIFRDDERARNRFTTGVWGSMTVLGAVFALISFLVD